MTSTPTANARRDLFERDGYVLLPEVLDTDLIKEAQSHVAWLMEKHPGVRSEHLGHTLVSRDPFWLRLVSDPRLLDIAEQFIGPNIALFSSHYISKPPRDGLPVLWHQDSDYWPLEPMQVVTLWLAVDDTDDENGCLRVIPGSHTGEILPHDFKPEAHSVLGAGINPELFDESTAVSCAMKAGGVEVHHPNIIHGSNANNSDRRRCGLTIRYIPTSTTITHDQWPCAFLLHGQEVKGVNKYLPFPKWVEGEHLAFAGCTDWK